MKQRKRWQQEIETKSEDQLRELIHDLGWEIEEFSNDYGEDFLVRIAENGNFTGDVFFVQLKGTDDIQRYKHKVRDLLRYRITTANLIQWHESHLPVLLILWDVKQRIGYWLHTQPAITRTLASDPDWLTNVDGTRTLYIPKNNFVALGETSLFTTHLNKMCEQIRLGEYLGHLETLSSTAYLRQELAGYEAMIAVYPSNAYLWAGKAEIHYDLKEFDNAFRAINKAWDIEKNDANIKFNRACILAEYAIHHGGEPKSLIYEAISLFSEIHEQSALVAYNLGNSFSALGKHDDARTWFNRALELQPEADLASQIYTNLGLVLGHLGLADQEVECFRKAISVEPLRWQAYASWAASEYRQGHFESAINLFAQAFKLNPEFEETDIRALFTVSKSLLITENYGVALSRADQVLTLQPDHEDARFVKASALMCLSDDSPEYTDKLLNHLKGWLIDSPDNVFVKSELAFLHASLGNKEAARELMESLIQLDDLPHVVLHDIAVFYDEWDEPEKAIDLLERALGQSHEHHIVHKLADLKKKLGLYQDAIKYYRLALIDVTDPHHIQQNMAECYFHLGQYRECINVLLVLIQADPTVQNNWENLAKILKLIGKFDLYYKFKDVQDASELALVVNEISNALKSDH